MKTSVLLLLLLSLLLSACHSVQRYEWVGAPSLRGAGGFMKKDGSIEIWVQGEPDRDYVPVKIVETTTSGTIGVEWYLFGVLKKETVELGGDGFILLNKDARSGGTYVTGTSATTGVGSIYGNTVATHSTTTGSMIAVPIQYNTYRALIFRYKVKAN